MVACEHHRTRHAQRLQVGDGLRRIGLHLVGDHHMARIAAVDRHMRHGAHMTLAFLTHTDRGAHSLHHTLVAHANRMAIHHGLDTLSGHLLHIADGATVVLARISLTQGCGNGMGGIALHMGRQMQQPLGAELLGMHGAHGEYALGERARLVEHHRTSLGQRVHIVASLDEDALARRTTDAAKEGERHRDDQGTRTTHHKERQCAIEPHGEALGVALHEEGRNEGQGQRQHHHDGRINMGKLMDECLTLRLVLA